MPANEIHLNDVGTKFLVTIKDGSSAVNISSASTKEIIIQKPSGTKITATATFDSDGTDGKIYYVTVADDLDEAGSYKLQGKVMAFQSNSLRVLSAKLNQGQNVKMAGMIQKLIGTEINNSSISAIVDDFSKTNGNKYYGN